ncbi:MAG: NADH-quinone oxidoreductase subunit L [Acidobacteriota bacterium]|nr:NADH-quinone oxidoreductase subunit L [Acidobacteriota bacterium]
MTALLLAIPLAPLSAAALAGSLRGRWRSASGWIALAGITSSVVMLALTAGSAISIRILWLRIADFRLDASLRLDGLSTVVGLLVSGISSLVTLYSIRFMRREEGQGRFFALLSFFAAAMLALVMANSMLLLFASWEAVGLASFALIGFWHRREEPRRAARKAFLMTRAGDMGLLLAWLLGLVTLGTTDIPTFLTAAASGRLPAATATWMALLLFAAAAGKSAQLPLTSWLPDAMAGPTPVSALIHSATMVAAGVYLVLRFFPVFEAAPIALSVVLWVGSATAVLAALAATAQRDIKRILAWSTASQLGEMMLALGLGAPAAAALHLTAHGAFKSSLFLAAGAVDRQAGSRDIRRLGGLASKMPLTAALFTLSALALAGTPPFSGWKSEERILSKAAGAGAGWGAFLLALIFLSGVYIGRAGMSIFGRWRGSADPAGRDPGPLMIVPLAVLAAAAASLGLLFDGPISAILGFGSRSQSLTEGWRLAAPIASLLGLATGVLRVRRAGPVPALGIPDVFTDTLEMVPRFTARGAEMLSAAIDRVERALDSFAQRTVLTARLVAAADERMEQGLDRSTRWLAGVAFSGAIGIDLAERRGFADEADRFARLVLLAGAGTSRLQTGKLYVYTAIVFGWLLLGGLVAVVLWR